MECNKDEGIRAKEIAERKFGEKDLMGAKKFALKAQSLYPGIDGIQQLLATLDVYMCAENKIRGEADWYGIIGVDPEADDETVKKQYRKLALSLHPDKNKFVGADGAFNLLKEAWDLLSDKTKRVAYDRRRNVFVHQKVEHQKVSTAQGSQGDNGSAHQKVSTAGQGLHGATGTTTKGRASNAKAQTATKRAAPSSTPASVEPIPKSFWSECPKCRMRFEYSGKYLRCNIFCPNCNKLFQAVEIVPPAICGSKSTTPFYTGRSTPASENVGETGFISQVSLMEKSVIWVPFSRAAGASQAAKAARVDLQGSARAARPSKPAKASNEEKRASKKGRKCNIDEETLARARESFTRDLNDDERKKRFDARRKKDFDASRRRDNDIL
ncbi:uncharacterized protein LOC133710378 [Rosa rugosa]|uniref:uncharacterized protein LOC133710378 n=1 Tax=Rosa rugosa TaxID=74645 RepID=UPI002B4010CE|nr:uncharacterized protein LOC133710378 [Rosa rugosa]